MTTTDDLTRIEVDEFFAHPPAKVWRALTTPDLMAQWLMPNDFEPIVGHRFTFEAKPVAQTGFSGKIACQVLEVVEATKLRISWADAASPDQMPTTVTWTLHPEGHGTRLFVEHAGFDPDDASQQLARQIMSGGWGSHLMRRLDEALSGTP